MTTETTHAVPPEEWITAAEALRADGFGYFDWLGCIDDIGQQDTFTVLVRLERLGPDAAVAWLRTTVPRDEAKLPSLRTVFAGASWHEREAGELFGVEFSGGDPRRLLLGPEFTGAPLRKDEVLAARTAVGWPGAKEPGESDASPSRRRMVPPGVPDPTVWGDRDATEPAASAADVAASAVGGRVRRRRR